MNVVRTMLSQTEQQTESPSAKRTRKRKEQRTRQREREIAALSPAQRARALAKQEHLQRVAAEIVERERLYEQVNIAPLDLSRQRAEHFERLRLRARDRLATMPSRVSAGSAPVSRDRPDVKPRPTTAAIFAAFELISARRNALNLIKVMTNAGQHVAATEERRRLIEDIRRHLEADGYDCARDMLAISTYCDDRLIGRIKRQP